MSTNPGLSNQSTVRNGLRIAGPVVLLAGIAIFIKGITGVFGKMDGFDSPSGLDIACFMGGFLLVGVGLQLTMVGFRGAAARYSAGELAPVAKDTLEYMTDGKGLGNLGVAAEGPFCRRCGTRNDATATFCDSCGAPLA